MPAVKPRDPWWIAAVLLVLGHLALTLQLSRGAPLLTPDSMEYAVLARSLLTGHGYTVDFVPVHLGPPGELRHVPELHGVLRPITLLPFFAWFGVTDDAVRLPGLLFLSGTGVLTFLFGRRLFGPAAGLLACVVSLAHPMAYLNARSGNDDAGFTFFALATLFFLHRALDKERRRDFVWAGTAAGLAILEKLSGIFLLGVLLGTLLIDAWRAGAGSIARRQLGMRAGSMVLPFALLFGGHVLRNAVAHGGALPRFGAVDWMIKAGGAMRYEALFALHDPVPGLLDTLNRIGWDRVPGLAAEQIIAASRWIFSLDPGPAWRINQGDVMAPGILGVLGVLALVFHLRRDPHFAVAVLLSILGGVGFICGLYHAEIRYFLYLTPLLALSLAGLLHRVAGPAGSRQRLASVGAGGVVAGLAMATFVTGILLGPRYVNREGLGPCRPAFAHFLKTAPPDARVLTFMPWSVSWEAGREAVQIPSGGIPVITRIARHYDSRWLLAPPRANRPLTLQTLSGLGRGSDPLGARVAFESRGCRLLELTALEPES